MNALRLFVLAISLGLVSVIARAQEPAATTPTEARPVALEVTVGMSKLSRWLVYRDDIQGSLADYRLPSAPSASFDLRWFPGAHFTRGIGSAFGLDVRYDRSFGIESQDRGATFANISRLLEVSVLGRFRRADYELIGVLGYGSHAFVFEPRTPTTNLVPGYSRVPGTDYRYLRIGGEARYVPGGRIGLLAGAAYLATFDLGGIASEAFFPHASGGGTELHAHLVGLLPRRFELRAGLAYRRYFLAMHSQLGDPRVAGGAVDHYLTLDLAASYRF